MRRWLRGAEAAIALAMAWVLIFVIPFRFTLARLGSSPFDAISPGPSLADTQRLGRDAASRVVRLSARLPFDIKCLQRALAALLMLRWRGVRTVIRLGVRKKAGTIDAHAWLMLGDLVLLGGQESADFTPIADIGDGSASGPGA